MNSLVGKLPSGAPFHHRLDRDRFTVGRSAHSTIRLVAASVSGLHAEIIAAGKGRYIVRDLGSTNGTFVNGKPVSETEVSVPCRLKFGSLECELRPPPDAPIPSPIANGRKSGAPPAEPASPPARNAEPVQAREPSGRRFTPLLFAGCLAMGVTLGFLISTVQQPRPAPAMPTPAPAPPVQAKVTPVEFPLAAPAFPRFDLADENWRLLPFAREPAVVETPIVEPEPELAAPAVPVSIEQAQLLSGELTALAQAAQRGDARALGIVAVLWDRGAFGPRDADAALDAAQSSAAQSSPFGDFALARLSRQALGGTKEESRAQQLGRQALTGLAGFAEAGDAWAENFTGELYELGLGVPKDPAQAAAHYRKAAELGDRLAIAKVAGSLVPRELLTPRPRALLDKLNVLILGDSMALCGFGKRLDERFRARAESSAVNTIMACGTNPLSWLQEKPFSNLRTHCGFWTINSVTGALRPAEFQDTYGMRRGHLPGSHPIPKLETLLATFKPNVLVMQCGTNLFSLFRGRRTVQPSRDAAMLKSYLAPFFAHALQAPSSVRRLYWVGSPISGRVSTEIQDFVFEQIKLCAGRAVTVIDSRPLIPYPYRHIEPDREHFFGPEMTQWADKVFDLVESDLSLQPLPAGEPAQPVVEAAAPPVKTDAAAPEGVLAMTARLIFKSQPIPLKELLPYQESLVAYVYQVTRVTEGQYEPQEVLVMHPAHIALKRQPLERYQLGGTYELRLRELETTLWRTVKCQDDSGKIDLSPYIQVEDQVRFPENL